MLNFLEYTLELNEYFKERGVDLSKLNPTVFTLKYWWENQLRFAAIYLHYETYNKYPNKETQNETNAD